MTLCRIDSAAGLEYTSIDARAQVLLNALNPNAQLAGAQVPREQVAPFWSRSPYSVGVGGGGGGGGGGGSGGSVVTGLKTPETRRLKVGFMSADFGVHPVAQLVRGLLDLLDPTRVEVYCFALHPKVSWWGENISAAVEHFEWLQGMNTYDAAVAIADRGVEVLIDLNGHTLHSGLTIMAHKPAPLQMSFLGLPTTTAAPFIDYYISDYVSVPAEYRVQFSEQLVLLPPSYIANDYAQMQGDVLKFSDQMYGRAPRSALGSPVDLSQVTLLFATLSNSQKMDPQIFQVWMNILRRFPGSRFLFIQHAGHQVYKQHLTRNAQSLGINPLRIVPLPQAPWIDHLYSKTALDVVLDTPVKNGHTTGLDGVWAGIPTVTLAGGVESPARAGESIAAALGSGLGLAYSLKEYEDLAEALARNSPRSRSRRGGGGKGSGRGGGGGGTYEEQLVRAREQRNKGTSDSPQQGQQGQHNNNHQQQQGQQQEQGQEQEQEGSERLRLWRLHVSQQRSLSTLFDASLFQKRFTQMLQGTWDLLGIAQSAKAAPKSETSKSKKSRKGPKRSILSEYYQTGKSDVRSSPKGETYNGRGLMHIFSAGVPYMEQYSGEPGTSGDSDGVGGAGAGTSPPPYKLRVQQMHTKDSLLTEAVQRIEGEGAVTVIDDGRDRPQLAPTPLRNAKEPPSSARKGSKKPKGRGPNSRSGSEESDLDLPDIPSYVFDGRLIMLNVGGLKAVQGWLVVNAQTQAHLNVADAQYKVDVTRHMHDLFGLDNSSVSALYSSHTLEHNSFGNGRLEQTLAEWYRVIRPGGLLLVSVPNLATLAEMYLDPTLSLSQQWMVTKMVYGAQSDSFDYHMVGFNFNLLEHFLKQAGFCHIQRVRSFNLPFGDSSDLTYAGYFISLNVAAKVCADGGGAGGRGGKVDDGFNVEHSGTPYEED
ncbi:glycosyl transferase family 41-domain-containing protein [Ochromonadaceae sp. CCMP2298]|nr:glycosyl transferase family 41-domain-containing protein [Ochromonadaceae sp. CCMP2298]